MSDDSVEKIFGEDSTDEEKNPWHDGKGEDDDLVPTTSSEPKKATSEVNLDEDSSDEAKEIKEEDDEEDSKKTKDDQKLVEEPVTGNIVVRITDSQKNGDGMNAFITYKIQTKTDLDLFGEKEMAAVRRYSDFVWLHEQLKSNYKAIVIPPLPEKGLMNRFSPEFIEYRRSELERFLRRIVSHPKLLASTEVKYFLKSSKELDKTVLEKTKKTEKKGWFATLTQKVSSVQTSVQSNFQGVQEIDKWYIDIKEYVEQLDLQLTALHSRTSSLTKRHKEMVQIWGDFSSASSEYSKAEEGKDKVLFKLFEKLADVSSQISGLQDETVNEEATHFEYPLKDYIRVVGAVKETLNNRDRALWEFNNADKTYQTKKSKNESGKDTVAAKKKRDELKKNFESISQECKVEINKFLQTKNSEITNALRKLVQSNMNHELRVLDLWKTLLGEIEEADA